MPSRDLQENSFRGVLGGLIAFAGLWVFGTVLITGWVVLAFIGGDTSREIVSGLRAGPVFIGVGVLALWGLIRFARFVQRRGMIRRPGAPDA